jgi:Ca-activated chloride channel family protein
LEVALFQDQQRKWNPVVLLRLIPHLFLVMMIAMALIALARPQLTNERVEQTSEGIDIMLVIDISKSMELTDFRPNRLVAAKNTAKQFIDGRFQDRIGVVVFSGEAFSLAPLTTDYKLLYDYVEEINFDLIRADGTAIGSALGVATNRMRESEANSKVVILLSDGENTAGNIDPITAANLAHAFNIKIYTVAMGKQGKIPYGYDPFGRPQYIENMLDETTLRKISEIGEGQFFRAGDNQALTEVFSQIDELEKSEIEETRYKDTTDFYDIYLSWAILFFLIWLAVKGTYISNILKD